MLLLLWTLDPTDSCRISLTDFACTLRFVSELTSSSSLNLSGLEVVIALFSHGYKDRDFPVTIGVGRPRAFSRVGQGISLSSPLQSLAPTTISRQCSLAQPMPLSMPELPVGLRLSKFVILSILSSVCTSTESETQLRSHLAPFFLGNFSAEKSEQKRKNSLTSSSINDVELAASDRPDSTESKRLKSMNSQSKRISEILKVVSVQHKRRKSDGNKKLLAHPRRRGRSGSTGSDIGETDVGIAQLAVQLPIKTKSDRTKILDAAVESLLYDGDDGVEIEKQLSYQPADFTPSEGTVCCNESSSESKAIDNRVSVRQEAEVGVEKLHTATAMQVEAEAEVALEKYSELEAQTATVAELYSVEAVCHFVSLTPTLQQVFEREIRSVMCQLVSASTRYFIEAKAMRKKSDGKHGDQDNEEKQEQESGMKRG